MPEKIPNNYEEAIDKYMNRRRRSAPPRNKKLPVIFILFSVLIIGFMLFFYFRSERGSSVDKDQSNISANIQYGGIQYQFSIKQDREFKKFNFSLIVENQNPAVKKLAFKDPVLTVNIRHKDTPIAAVNLGGGVKTFMLKPKEVREFFSTIAYGIFYDYADSHREFITPRRQTLFSMDKRHIPLVADIVVQTGDLPGTKLNFRYLVD